MSEQSATRTSKPEGPWVAHALKPGHAIMEYVVDSTLGGGGFGITYLARDGNLNLPVAIKEYLPTDMAMRAGDGSVQALGDSYVEQFNWGLERFLDEARAMATFRHPNIVRALRYFQANGTAYIVMEFESGESLKKWLPRQKGLNNAALLKLVNPLLDGLEVIHNAGYLHRDIKPDNIYVRNDSSPVLIDFGSARNTTDNRELTSIVTPGFAPFEQYQSKGNQGPWTDLYSLAAVMYWLISGQKPLSSLERMKQDAMVPASQLDHHNLIGVPMLSAIDWALNPDEMKRPQSVAEFRRRLHESVTQDTTVRNSEQADATVRTWDATTPSKTTSGVTAESVAQDKTVRNSEQADATVRTWDATTPSKTTSDVTANEATGTNLVCSILFLDIVAYSKTSVNEQYELKTNFNQLIAGKLAHIPESNRITLDTGDGAVICFMGDPEEVLYAARAVQKDLAQQKRLQVRMGLHIGPIRVINDLNGHKNVIGDGINVGQRVMSFADSNALVVSRAFYEIVACITNGGERGFTYLGERRDKHDRAHEIYAVVSDFNSVIPDDIPATQIENSQNIKNEIDATVVASIEKELTRHLGPLAPVLIRKLKPRVANEIELVNQLALSIGEPAHREDFSRVMAKLHRNSDGHSSPVSASNSQNNSHLHVASVSKNNSVSISESSAATRPWLTAECNTILEKSLARAIGPMARVVLKNETRKSENLAQLREALSLHIDNAEIRTQFLKDTSTLLKST
jgi:serine/threonine protein kinase